MAFAKQLRRAFLFALLAVGLLLWLAALLRFSQIAENSDSFAQYWDWILLINTVGIAVLAVLIVSQIGRMIRDYRRHVPGIRLRTRMVLLLVVLAVTPLVIVYLFSVAFINRGIDNWFSIDVERGLQDALALSQTALDIQKRERLNDLEAVAQRLAVVERFDLISEISTSRRTTRATELTLYDANGRIVATNSTAGLDAPLPQYPSEEVLFQLQQSDGYVALEPRVDNTYEIVAVTRLPATEPRATNDLLQAVFPVDQRLTALLNAVNGSVSQYAELTFLRGSLKASFTLTLSLVLLVSVLASVYGAFFFAERLLVPIQQLMQGTRAVARGDFDTMLPTPRRDEIGFLVNSFNDMTQRLSQAREQASRSQQLVESQRKQLEVILAGLTTGVISLDADMRIRTANAAASGILGADIESRIGEPLAELASTQPLLSQFLDVTLGRLARGEQEWREQIVLQGEVGRRVLMCACTGLPEEEDSAGGVVVVFDDITALLQAQRDAAWGEVARRLAHEIKNPLTPIQLSAERLRRRYLAADIPDADLLDRATHTIIQQVVAMKEMVDAFSLYARTPALELSTVDVNGLITEVTELYRAQDAKISLELDQRLPAVRADIGRMRQVFHNLLRNSLEAADRPQDVVVTVSTRQIQGDGEGVIEITVADNGPGFADEIAPRAFEPYVTSKTKGTGLGLAIVKKIVEEHGGHIHAGNRKPHGAEISILLPVSGGSAMLTAPRHEQRRERA
jgi:two-component system, NtrC family, nitrogen regulation sensor histidine kinase NtrY